ncbi:DUF1749-domain-containing protein, partial [Lentithecium fluviatile CBS 122367]
MAHPGTIHMYNARLFAFEHAPPTPNPNGNPPNTLLWIGGLGDGLLTVHYPRAIAAALPPTWVLAEVLLSSSYKGWATGSLSRDSRELSECVKYFKSLRPGGKVVLMGHSTGCQDAMEYLVGEGSEGREKVDGAVLQAGVSDREAWIAMAEGDEKLKRVLEGVVGMAKSLIDQGKGKEALPREGNPVAEMFGTTVTAYRAYSLLAPGGDDDYFSSDLSDTILASTFGSIPRSTPIMFLWGSEDPYVPSHMSKEGILKRWGEFVRRGGGVVDDVNGGVVRGAHHNLNDDGEGVVKDLVGRVLGFLEG